MWHHKVLLISALVSTHAFSDIFEIKLSKKMSPPVSRALFGGKSSGPNYATLEAIRAAQWKRDYAKCADLISAHRGKFQAIAPWMAAVELQCLSKITEPKREHALKMQGVIERVEKQKEWILFGAYNNVLKTSLVEAKFVFVNWQAKFSPQEVWKYSEDLLKYQDWMTNDQKADAFRLAGEHSFLRQRLLAAKRFVERSLELRDDEKLRGRLTSIDAALKTNDAQAISKGAVMRPGKDEKLEASEKELEYYDRMKLALRSGDLVAAVEDGVRLTDEFPFGTRASWAADRIFESFSGISAKEDPNFVLLKSRLIKQMLKADGRRLSEWALQAFKSGLYPEARELGEQALRKIGSNANVTALLFAVARATSFSGDSKEARKDFVELYTKHAGTSESRWALFYTALIDYRAGDFTAAVAGLERLLVLPGSDDQELETRYWLWRSLQKVDDGRAKAEAENLISLFPFTYYGLRARAETHGGIVDLELLRKDSNLSTSLWLTEPEKKSWERIQILLAGGWWIEAQEELEDFPVPKDPVARSYLANYWASAFGYQKGLKMISEGWDADPRLAEGDYFTKAFPREFEEPIVRESKKNGLEPLLVRSLIRQESAYNFMAKSRSGALGLMQMIPPTVEEVAKDLRVKGLQLPEDMYNPDKNVQFCTYYLAKVLKQFNGNVPAALAAYNAGPSRISKWLASKRVELAPTSDPTNEIWIDELPWNEPKFYVKAIMRNLILYRAVTQDGQNLGRVILNNPIWVPDSVAIKP